MKATYKYVKFEKGRPGSWFCRDKSQNIIFGLIEFYTPWEKYCFSPAGGQAKFEKTCLLDIVNFIDQLKED